MQKFAGPSAVILLTLAGAFVRIYGLGAWDYYYDEIWHVYVAAQHSVSDVFYTNLKADGHPVLPYLLWHYGLKLWDDPWMARLPSLIAGILSIPMGYLLGKELFRTENGGLFAAFFIAFSNLMIEQSEVVRGYMLMMLFVMIALWSVYRYRRTPSTRYLAIYGVSAFLALLCEYAAIPLIVFTALHLLCSIYKQPINRLRAFIIYTAIHLGLLAYLLWFTYLLHHIGKLGLGELVSFQYNPPIIKMLKNILFFADFINDTSFIFNLTLSENRQLLGMISFFIFLFAGLSGFAGLIRGRQWWLLTLVALPIIIALSLDYLDMIPLGLRRRNMGLSIPILVLFYSGFTYIANHGIRNSFLSRIRPDSVMLAGTIVLFLSYAADEGQWRIFRPMEFQETRKDTQEIYQFLGEHLDKNDIIVTDLPSYYRFWKDTGECDTQTITPTLIYYPCYRAPLYVILNDVRVNPFIFNISELQDASRELDRLHRLDPVKNIWLIALEHTRATVLSQHFAQSLPIFSMHEKELNALVAEQESFARYVYQTATLKKIAYTYPCTLEDDTITVGGDDDCITKIILVALPKAAIYERVINHSPYISPLTVMDRIYHKTK